jgi:hypothetical protein
MPRATILTRLGGALMMTALFTAPVLADDKVPETPAEQQQAAADYQAKAKGHRAESEMHSRMAEMYGARIKGPHNRKPNPWLVNMVTHCKGAAAKANDLAKAEETIAKQLEQAAKGGTGS